MIWENHGRAVVARGGDDRGEWAGEYLILCLPFCPFLGLILTVSLSGSEIAELLDSPQHALGTLLTSYVMWAWPHPSP